QQQGEALRFTLTKIGRERQCRIGILHCKATRFSMRNKRAAETIDEYGSEIIDMFGLEKSTHCPIINKVVTTYCVATYPHPSNYPISPVLLGTYDTIPV
ncbi:MAG: hypothetical protein AAB422_07520, partial [Planctomycetota bacterium]